MSSFLVAFLVTALITPGVMALTRRMGWVAYPREDRWHSRPTALMGGIAIFLGTVSAWAWTGDFRLLFDIGLPASAMFILGLLDDRLHLRPHLKLIGQITAGVALISRGIYFEAMPLWISLALTLVWLVGITNAVNLLDNMDGLAAGVSGIAAFILACLCFGMPGSTTSSFALGLVGACAAFLLYNYNPARIFMGDCGSMFIGFSLASLALQGAQRSAPNLMLSLMVPVALLAVPIFDTTLVSVVRTLHGRPVSQGGRDHSSHRLVALGLSERSTALVLYALTALFGAWALAATRLPLLVVILVAVILAIALAILGLYLGLIQIYSTADPAPTQIRQWGGKVYYKKQLLQLLLDIPLVPVAFVGAHLLRFEGELPNPIEAGVMAALPFVLASKLMGLAFCRCYRGVWRYAGVSDVLAASAGSTIGSLLAVGLLAVFTGFSGLSRTALVIDWLLFTPLAVTVRMGYVLLQHLFGTIIPRDGLRVVIVGAGAEASALISRLRDPQVPGRTQILGILDDNGANNGRAINGVPVLGSLADLRMVIKQHSVNCCILGVSMRSEQGQRILALCEDQKVQLCRDLDALHLLASDRCVRS